jgi:hypothetical protein
MLHAREVVVPISKNKPPARVVAPVPLHMRNALQACGWNGEEPDAQGVGGCLPSSTRRNGVIADELQTFMDVH